MQLKSLRYRFLICFVSLFTFYSNGQTTYINMPANLAADIINSNPLVPTPYDSYVNNWRYQFIYSRNELVLGGAPSDTGCYITSIAWHIIRTINAAYYATGSGLKGYTIRMRNIPDSIRFVGDTLRKIGPEYIVKNPFDLNQSVVPDTGYTDLVFDQEFEWDGRGNILIDICYGLTDGTTPAVLGIFSNANSGVAALSYFGEPDTGRVGIGTAFITPSKPVCDTMGNAAYFFIPRPVAKLGFRPLAPVCKPKILPALPEVCAGSPIQLSVTGADTYTWNLSPLLSCNNCNNPEVLPTRDTTLRVIGKKGSCIDSAFVRIRVKTPIPISIFSDPVDFHNLCNGPISLSISPGFTDIEWSNTSTDSVLKVINPGTYSVTALDSLGCLSSPEPLEIIRSNSPLVDILPLGNLYLCNGDIELSGTPGLTDFSWSGGETSPTVMADEPGNFILQAMDSLGCKGISDTTKVFPGYVLDVKIVSKDTLICEGGQALIESVNTFDHYNWSNGDTNKNTYAYQPGDYFLTVTDANGCEAVSDTISYAPNYTPEALFIYEQPFFDYTIQFTSTSLHGKRFFWDFGAGNTSTLENPSFAFPFDDTYPVTLIVTNDCGNDTILVNVIVKKLVSINDLVLGITWEIMPNPAQDFVVLKFGDHAEKLSRLEIFNYAGQLVYSEALQLMNGPSQKQINIQSFAPGVYWVVVGMNEKREFRRLIVQ